MHIIFALQMSFSFNHFQAHKGSLTGKMSQEDTLQQTWKISHTKKFQISSSCKSPWKTFTGAERSTISSMALEAA